MNRRRSESDLEMMRRSHPRSRHLHGNSERRRQNNPHRTRRATVDTHHGGSTSSDDESMFDIRNIEVFEKEGEGGEQSQSQQLVIYDEEQAEKIDPDGSHINNIMEEDGVGVLLIEGEKEDDCQHLYLPPPSSSSEGNEKYGTSFDVDVDEMDVQVDASTHHQHSGKKKKKRKSSKHQRYAQ